MWILKIDNQNAIAYKEILFKYTGIDFTKTGKKKVKKELRSTYAYKYFSKDKFEEYLIAEPKRLLEMHEELYNNIKDEHGNIRTNEITCIKSIVNYKSYISKKKELSYGLAKIMDINTCTYCNRQYTLTVGDDDEHLIRPEFDHWFSQSDCPDLALSYYNLIPSCKLCNSSLKHEEKMSLDKYIHPYVDKKVGFNFTYAPTEYDNYAVDIDIENTVSKEYQKRIENTIKLFKLRQIYGAHSEYELKDLLQLSQDNSSDYIEILIKKIITDLHVNEHDAYRMLFGIEMDENNFLKRPFSKFKHDIIKQIIKQHTK